MGCGSCTMVRVDMGSASRPIVVSAVSLVDDAGRIILVRKRGTSRFMHPGGKPEVGETPVETAIREVEEELGLVLAPADLVHLGVFHTETANEPGCVLRSDLFVGRCPGVPEPRAEIEEIRWSDPADVAGLRVCPDDLAPLYHATASVLLDHLRGLPRGHLRGGGAGSVGVTT